ncbi:polyamine aminopropyltransferase [Burkholderiaceae bacterium FT117]|uniref:polyamine aminopropyltransferase n=1 Tax=Zeimonas sediminis TaxID=2944268 RepID=UPI002342FC70|nr:polyamine aminopropyltransferase [Zeimonas sediminis]MCM5570242.1 polyamine aminopropyltransferase [Zeimonas sediminis]
MQGLHLTADLYGCQCEASLLVDAEKLAGLCRQSVENAGLTLVDEKYFTFPEWQGQPGGVTGAALLAESHLALHTWPERGGVTLDVYVCNFSTDNSHKAERLLDDLIVAFAPRQQGTNRILRGSRDPETRSDELLLEWLNEDSAYGFRATRRLETIKTQYQLLEVFDTPQWGKLFRLDGCYMTSERDEFYYHEPIVHAAAIAHPAPRSALVIGGGDGGSSEELLKHPTMQRVVMAELDPEVVRVAREHLQGVHGGVFDDPRLTVEIGDGWKYVERLAGQPDGERFDLIVLDLTDPDTPAHQLYTPEFFRLAKKALAPGGALSLHIGSPVYSPGRVRELVSHLSGVFANVRPFGLYVPLYGAYWGMACASDALDPLAIDPDAVEARLAERGVSELQYYNGDVHRALFALPNFFRKLVR